MNDSYVNVQWKEELDPSGMSIEEIETTWRQLQSLFARGYIEFVWNHKNITKDQKLLFLHDVLRDSRGSLQAAHWAAKTLAKEGNVTYNPPFNFSNVEKWWKKRGMANGLPDKVTNKKIHPTN